MRSVARSLVLVSAVIFLLVSNLVIAQEYSTPQKAVVDYRSVLKGARSSEQTDISNTEQSKAQGNTESAESANNEDAPVIYQPSSTQPYSTIRYTNKTDLEYKGGFGISAGYLERYDIYDSRKPFKGLMLNANWLESNRLHRIEVSRLDSELEVLGPGVKRQAARHWDLVYSFEKYDYLSDLRGLYFMPAVGLRLKERLTVTCQDKKSHCFYSTYDAWDIESRSEELLPLLGLNSGIYLYSRYLYMDMGLNLLTDTDSVYLGWNLTLGMLYPRK